MSFAFNKTSPATGAAAVFELKTLLKLQGFTVLASSDGTTYNAAGDQITVPGSGAGGMANNNAWFRIRAPGGAGAQEWTFQRGTTNPVWRVKRSLSNPFTGGSPGATQTPSATNEFVVMGGGTDASPTFGTWFGTDATYRWNCAVDNAAPYGWWAGAFPIGGGNPTAVLICDPLVGCAPADGDKYAIVMGCSGNNQLSITTITAETGSGTTSRLIASVISAAPTTYQQFPGQKLSSDTGDLVPSGLPTNPLTLADEGFPIVLGRRSALADAGYKGVTSLMKWIGTTRSTGATLTVSTTADRIIYRAVSLPWDGSVPAV